MNRSSLRGVIAASITPIHADGTPDIDALLAHLHHLLENGCDAINLLGTTGEATSFSVTARMDVMRKVAASGLPLSRFMVGTGTSALDDTVALTKLAGELGYAGALVLPPFYYKPVSDAGMIDYFGRLTAATAEQSIPLYLYNFPALSGITYSVELVTALVEAFGERIAGLKDSSGNLDYAKQIGAISPALAIFPSNEATLLEARDGAFAGCISATANLNSAYCAAAFHHGDRGAQATASAIRSVFDGFPLVPAVKSLVAHLRSQPGLERVLPPLIPVSPAQVAELVNRNGFAGGSNS